MIIPKLKLSFTYDTFNRLSTKVKQNNTYTYLYDNSNNLAVKKDTNNNTCKYIYDLASRIVEYKENDNYKISYKYDNRNNISKVDYQLNSLINTLNYSYDNDSKQLSYTINNNPVTYNYDLFSRLNKKEIGNYITTYEYLNLEGNKTTTLLDTITNNNSEIRYVYDEVGNITKIYKDEVLENEYEYDSLNQLSIEKTYSLNQKVEYTYDNGGNILTKVYKYLDTDAIINTYNYSYDTVWKDQLINYNGNAITYDEIGNPLTYGNNITYSWINGRELSTYTDTSKNLEVEYVYNDEGIRTSKIINGVEHKYYLEGTNIVYETIGENTLYYFYDSTGSIEGFKYNNDLYYYIKNGQNDIIGIIDDEGNQVVSYTYDSWGQIISIIDSLGNEITDPTNIGNINPFRYRSYYYDSEIGLYYLNSRYYNPEIGRFLNADGYVSTAQGLTDSNMFAYTGNNPIIRSDMTGNVWDTVLDIVGVSISFTDFIKKPTWGTFGLLAADAGLAILPFVPSISGVKAGVKIVNKVDNVADTAKTGWKVGDNITNFTRAGNAPAWNTVKSRYWKNEAFLNPDLYPNDLARMQKGLAPRIQYDFNSRYYSMELHHKKARRLGGTNEFNNLMPVSPWDHAAIDQYRHFKP